MHLKILKLEQALFLSETQKIFKVYLSEYILWTQESLKLTCSCVFQRQLVWTFACLTLKVLFAKNKSHARFDTELEKGFVFSPATLFLFFVYMLTDGLSSEHSLVPICITKQSRQFSLKHNCRINCSQLYFHWLTDSNLRKTNVDWSICCDSDIW